MSELGRLVRVELRDIWKTEAQDFTPWLAREGNLALLSETLGIDLELEAVEQNVGPFRADILCKDTLSDRWVLVENQLERTDHTHLGQLMTYAAGLDAVTIVWVAARVADEHRAAMDWLNEITRDDVKFFALEVELWRISDSPAAPKFNIVSKPNDWSRSASGAQKAITDGELSPTRQMQREYWAGVQELVANAGGPLRSVSPPAQSWVVHGIGKSGVILSLVMNTVNQWIRTEVYFTGRWAKSDFAELETQKAEIEEAMGMPLDWQPLPEKRDARICIVKNADPRDRPQWPEQHQWLLETASKMHQVFQPYIANLTRAEAKQ